MKGRIHLLSLALTILSAIDFINGDFFRDIYDEYKDKVYKNTRKIISKHQDAEEVVQDVFFKVYRNIGTFRDIPHEEFEKLLAIYTKNTAIDYLRKKSREVKEVDTLYEDGEDEIDHDIIDPSPEPDEIIIGRERAVQISIYINDLPEKQRHVILLRYKYNMSEKSIAKAMSMTETAVSSCVNRARKKLRERMEQEK